jgi:lipoprotein-anchoring transpeptidase ErfK/SrfK
MSQPRADGARSPVSMLSFVVVVVLAVAGFVLLDGDGAEGRGRVPLAKLTASTTDTTLRKAPKDPAPMQATDGEVVHPLRTLPLFAKPGKAPFGRIGPRQIGETWLPVVDRRGGWSRVLLPSRPNGSTGWVRTDEVERRTSPYLVRVHLASRTLELLHEGRNVGSWTVAVGRPETPTPSGRTFLLGSVTDEEQSFSPVILPLGAHSDTLDTYGGGPGTVAIHGWPDSGVFGAAVSHGCIRVPDDALNRLTRVPLGTVVIVDEQ